MLYEVEKKFAVDDLSALQAKLTARGAAAFERREEVDTYFAHPSRDFRRTDEALRLRRVNESHRVTYKGPRIDRETKTRREIELPLGEGAAVQRAWTELLLALGFREVGSVRKFRLLTRLPYAGLDVTITLDDVDEVGTYCELELVAEEEAVSEAKRVLQCLAEDLGLTHGETRSYLNLLMAKRGEA